MTTSLVYWIIVLDNIRTILEISLFLLIVLSVTLLIYNSIVEKNRVALTGGIICLPIIFLISIAVALLPSTKQAAAIYIIPKIANNEHFQGIPNKLFELGESWLDELKPKSEQEDSK